MDSQQSKAIFNLNVRIFSRAQHKQSHSYLIGDMPQGISHIIGVMRVNIRGLSLRQLRPMLEYDKSGHMDKRSLLFQEAMFIMRNLPSTNTNPEVERTAYRLGFLKKDRSELRIVETEHEELPICEIISAVDFIDFDLAIVPLSQLHSIDFPTKFIWIEVYGLNTV